MRIMIKTLCVYCGSNTGNRPEYIEAAKKLAEAFVDNDIDLVYGGANVGIMGVLADTMLKHEGKVTGVIPWELVEKEVAHSGLTELRVVDSMHERKAIMTDLSDGFIALPGGLGTIEELFEVLTWAQLGMHEKACGLLNVCGYYDKLAEFCDHAVSERFVKSEHRSMLLIEKDPNILLKRIETYEAPDVAKWIGRNGT